MPHIVIRAGVAGLMLAAAAIGGPAPSARADEVAYLIGVTARPGYNFPGPDAALAYGRGVCVKIEQGVGYPQLIGEVKADFATTDEYQAAYLVNQSANELCPAMIWQLRNSAAGYRPPPDAT